MEKLFIRMFLIYLIYITRCESKDGWRRPGCHKVGHSRTISIPDCLEFHVTTNACRGYCQSWSIPSSMVTILSNPDLAITSVGQCCNIMDTENISIPVKCLDGDRTITFKSATQCSCYHCKKD